MAHSSEVFNLKPTSVSPWERWRPRRLLLPPPDRRGRQRSQGKICLACTDRSLCRVSAAPPPIVILANSASRMDLGGGKEGAKAGNSPAQVLRSPRLPPG